MTRRDLAAGAFIVTGLYVWILLAWAVAENVVSVATRASTFYDMTHSEYLRFVRGSLFAYALPLCLVFVAGYVLVFRARAFANRLFPEKEGGGDRAIVAGNTVHGYAVAIALLGLYVAVGAASALAFNICLSSTLGAQQQAEWWAGHMDDVLIDMAGSLVRLILGGVLFFKAAAITAYWHERMEREKVPSQR